MDEQRIPGSVSPPLRYRLVIEGHLDGSWASWFDSDGFRSGGGRTVIDVEVIDQAQLHAVLRRVHDLHLRLESVTRVDTEATHHHGGPS